MDLNALLGTLLSDESIAGVSQKAEASPEEVRGVLGNALPLLLGGANAQATNAATADGFAGALQQHAQSNTGNLGSFLGGVDMVDGAKIIAHLLGANTQAQTQTLAQQSGVSEAKTGNILAVAAPLLMSLIGQQSGNASGANVAGLMGSLLGSGDISGLLGGLLGGGQAAAQPAAAAAPVQEAKRPGLLAKLLGLLK